MCCLISLDVEYTTGTKIESKANKIPSFGRELWKRTAPSCRNKYVLLLPVDDAVSAGQMLAKTEGVEFTAACSMRYPRNWTSLWNLQSRKPKTKEEKQAVKTKKKQLKELRKKRNKLQEYDQHLEIMGERNSYSKTGILDTRLCMKEDYAKTDRLSLI